ncbi:MAG: hypothetical protein AUH30_12790 [Candidatus Rokubacteria bacterium 13_1_40CM_68_15]|nr:MAG: hypothetical protein AUH30_12790 [Candidatus Rokubacteria bacterium 13_1_40CM_68_15]
MRQGRLPFLTVVAAALLAGCATHRLDTGVFHSAKGYRVTVPGPGWTMVLDARGDLELRDASDRAGILVHADCDARRARRPLVFLERRLLLGLTQRRTVEQGEATVNGHRAAHSVLEAANGSTGSRMKIETFVVTDGRCVYDLIYAAEPSVFAAGRADFERLVQSFATE